MAKASPQSVVPQWIGGGVLCTSNAQASLWEAILPAEVLGLPTELAVVDRLLDDPVFIQPFRAHFDPTSGRPSIPIDTYLRLLFLKHRYGLGYELLCRLPDRPRLLARALDKLATTVNRVPAGQPARPGRPADPQGPHRPAGRVRLQGPGRRRRHKHPSTRSSDHYHPSRRLTVPAQSVLQGQAS
jgi:hypothetical protein